MPAKRKSDERPGPSGSNNSKKKTSPVYPKHRSLRSFFNKKQNPTANTSSAIEKSSHLPHASPRLFSQSFPSSGAQVVSNETAELASRDDGIPIAQAGSSSFAQNSTLVTRPKTVSHQAGLEFHTASLKDDGNVVETANPWEDHAPREEIASTSTRTIQGGW
ncbi:uncharacterized protein N7458_007331 [Penicillium daleae]|uniref:Uncharacterized protein n=1 Tax=Penicillium daleae TaxID=63821 RepID=A0AAD6C1Q2_9EURO|nr:uncharacterized protein N7458_007331 [Penicillium daleae]KAJ5443459.1 hypothetical protein N7458_007331 [Penicillium daleae]